MCVEFFRNVTEMPKPKKWVEVFDGFDKEDKAKDQRKRKLLQKTDYFAFDLMMFDRLLEVKTKMKLGRNNILSSEFARELQLEVPNELLQTLAWQIHINLALHSDRTFTKYPRE